MERSPQIHAVLGKAVFRPDRINDFDRHPLGSNGQIAGKPSPPGRSARRAGWVKPRLQTGFFPLAVGSIGRANPPLPLPGGDLAASTSHPG